MKINFIIITLIICATTLVMFYSYHFYFTDYAKCLGIEKFKYKEVNDKDKRLLNRAKLECFRLTK